MLVWILVIVVTVIACGTLFYAGRSHAVNATGPEPGQAERENSRQRLAELERAEADGLLSAEEGRAARAELAREVIRSKADADPAVAPATEGFSPRLVGGVALVIAALAIGTYGLVGAPGLPGAPLSGRNAPDAVPPEVASAIEKVEAQLLKTPDDLRGWQVIAPVYLRADRFADAVNAYRRVLALAGATPDAETDLAEALSAANGGAPTPEALSLLEKAAADDAKHVRSRFYLATDALDRKDFARAKTLWQEVLALAVGSETWLPMARQGLAMAEAAGATAGDPASQDEMIAGMVEGLASRLAAGGGSVAEWTRLVRAYIVLGARDKARKAYDDARAAYPDAGARAELDAFAAQNGLN